MTGTVLVSGGSGYIAGFLIRQLVAEAMPEPVVEPEPVVN